MIKAEFKGFLKDQGQNINQYYINGKALGLNAINDIIKWAKGVERVFGVDLNVVVADSITTENMIRDIQNSDLIFEKEKLNFSRAVRAYFHFVNGIELN